MGWASTRSAGCRATGSAWRSAPRPGWCSIVWGSTRTTSTATSAGSAGAGRGTRSRSGPSICSKSVDAALFGAITSKPVKAAEAELAPELQGKGLVYRSPIVRMRQLFDLYVCLRPVQGLSGQPLNFKEGIDLVVFRENTEDLYAGVEFNPVPQELADTLAQPLQELRPVQEAGRRRVRHLLQDQHPGRVGAHRPGGLRVRPRARAQEGHHRPQGQRGARHRRSVPGGGARRWPRTSPTSR